MENASVERMLLILILYCCDCRCFIALPKLPLRLPKVIALALERVAVSTLEMAIEANVRLANRHLRDMFY